MVSSNVVCWKIPRLVPSFFQNWGRSFSSSVWSSQSWSHPRGIPSRTPKVLPHRLHKQGVLAKQVETCCDVLKMRKPHKSQTFRSWSEGRWAATAGLFILPFVWQMIPRFCGEQAPTFVSSGIFYYHSKHGPVLISFPSSKRSQTKVQWNRIQGEQENGKQR